MFEYLNRSFAGTTAEPGSRSRSIKPARSGASPSSCQKSVSLRP